MKYSGITALEAKLPLSPFISLGLVNTQTAALTPRQMLHSLAFRSG